MSIYLKKVENELSLETIFSIITDDELKDITFCKKLIDRALKENNNHIVSLFFERIADLFLFNDSAFRQSLVDAIYPILQNLTFETLVSIAKETIFGTVVALYCFMKKNHVIKPKELKALLTLSSLKYLSDPCIFELIPIKEPIVIDLDDNVTSLRSHEEIDGAVRICELLLDNGIIKRNKSSIRGLHILYKNAHSPELRAKEDITIVLEQQTNLVEYQKKIDDYQSLISEKAEEPKFQSFFETNPTFLNWQVVRFLSKKSFGGEQFPDLILVLRNRNYVIVELEKPAVKLYTKKGDPTQELSHAEEQVREYLHWAIEEKEFLRKRGLENLSADNTTGLLVIGSDLTQEERRKLDTRNNSLRSMFIIKTFSEILEQNEATLENLGTMPKK